MKAKGRKSENPLARNSHLRCVPDHYSGCLLGGAVADALGAAAEGLSHSDVHEHFGPDGLRDYAKVFGREGAFTAHTQLVLFTAEGVLRAKVKAEELALPLSIVPPVYNAYQRWLATQDGLCDASQYNGLGGGHLIQAPELYQERHAEACCLEALTNGRLGQPESPINDSRGCGAAVRMAPLGLFFCSESIFRRLDPATIDQTVFALGCQLAALTHGHPDAFLAAACQALLVFRLIRGDELYDAVQNTLVVLGQYPRHEPCRNRLEDALIGVHDCESHVGVTDPGSGHSLRPGRTRRFFPRGAGGGQPGRPQRRTQRLGRPVAWCLAWARDHTCELVAAVGVTRPHLRDIR
jgi:ADP-ribosylglycohydrolase